MKYIILIFLTTFFFTTVIAQKKATKNNPQFQQELNMILIQESLSSGLNALNAHYTSIKYSSPGEVKQIFLDSVGKPGVLTFKKYKSSIISYLDGLNTFGETPANMVLEGGKVPFTINVIGGKKAFIQSGIFDSYSLNTLKLDVDERAKHIVQSIILPSLANLRPLLSSTDISLFIINVGYLAKDFSDDNSGDGEMTSIIIDRVTLEKYINAEITDKDVYRSAKFYNSNKNTTGSIRRITVN